MRGRGSIIFRVIPYIRFVIEFKGVRNNLQEISVIYNDISIYFGDVIVAIQCFCFFYECTRTMILALMLSAQIGTRNKPFLIYQFGNNVFHAQIGTRNKTVLNHSFGNSVFHFQLTTRNKVFLSYLTGNALYLLTAKRWSS